MAARADVPVLCWHQIRAATARDSATDRTYIVSPKTLAAQLAALDRAGYHAVTGQALVAHVALGKRLPRKPVLLTFDDASAGQYTRALPLLRRHHFVATFFVMTVVLDKPGWLTSGQVRAARPRGHDDRPAHLRPPRGAPVPGRRLAHAAGRARRASWRSSSATRCACSPIRSGSGARRPSPSRRRRLRRGLPARRQARPPPPAVDAAAHHRAGALGPRAAVARSSATSEETRGPLSARGSAPPLGRRRLTRSAAHVADRIADPAVAHDDLRRAGGPEVVVGTGIGDGAGAAAPASEGTISAAVTAAMGTARAARRRRERDWESTCRPVLPAGAGASVSGTRAQPQPAAGAGRVTRLAQRMTLARRRTASSYSPAPRWLNERRSSPWPSSPE